MTLNQRIINFESTLRAYSELIKKVPLSSEMTHFVLLSILILLSLGLTFLIHVIQKTVLIQIRWLRMKPSDQDPHCFPL